MIRERHGGVLDFNAVKSDRPIAVAIPLAHEAGQRLTDPFFSEMITHLADEITRRGYAMFLRTALPPLGDWLGRLIKEQAPAAVIVIGQSTVDITLDAVASFYHPMVVWGGDLGSSYCTVGTDNVAGAVLAVEHLLSIGRRRIIFLGDPIAPEVRLRLEGYHTALERAGIAALEHIPTHLMEESAEETMRAVLSAHGRFDAIFAASDVIAIGAARAVLAAGMRVPEDVAIVGFDDIARAVHATPQITTVRQNLAQGAHLLVELACRRGDGEDTPSTFMVPELIVRESTVGSRPPGL